MTSVALRAVLAQMAVILVMAGPALLRHLLRAGRLEMTFGALQFAVRAQQRKMRFLGMIEHPHRPPVGGVTAFALLAEPPLVHVIMRMAVDARRRRPVEGLRRVALRTADEAVQPEQGKLAQVMLKHDIAAPGVLAVTGLAPAVRLGAVGVFAAMTADAVLG